MSSPKFVVGQRVGILAGLQATNGPHVAQYGTVVDVTETWTDTLEYVVEADDGTRLMYRAYLLASDEREERAHRAASYFDQVRAQRDDVAAGAHPSLSLTPIVLAPRFLSGTIIGKRPARIVGAYGFGYLVRFLSDGVDALAFPHELTL